MIPSRQKIKVAAKKGWTNIDENFDDFLSDGICCSQNTIVWSDSDEDDHNLSNPTFKPAPIIKKIKNGIHPKNIPKNKNTNFIKTQTSPILKRRATGTWQRGKVVDQTLGKRKSPADVAVKSHYIHTNEREEHVGLEDNVPKLCTPPKKRVGPTNDVVECNSVENINQTLLSSPILNSKRKSLNRLDLQSFGLLKKVKIKDDILFTNLTNIGSAIINNEFSIGQEEICEKYGQQIEMKSLITGVQKEDTICFRDFTLNETADYILAEFDSPVLEDYTALESQILSTDGSSSPIIKSKKTCKIELDNIGSITSSNAIISSQVIEETKRGSDWLKGIVHKTPEKNDPIPSDLRDFIPQPPDSSKKRVKKDGLAENFKKLLQTWQSDASMWIHEMNQALISERINSPIIFNESNSPLPIQNNYRTNRKLFEKKSYFKSPNLYNKILKSPFQRNSTKFRNSLELSSPSSVGSSLPLTNFSIPKKFLRLKIFKILKENFSTSRALECTEIENSEDYLCKHEPNERVDINSKEVPTVSNLCESQHIESVKEKKYIVFLGQFCPVQGEELMKEGDEIKLYPPWQVLQNKFTVTPCLFSSHYILSKNDETEIKLNKKAISRRRKRKLASWQCACEDSKTMRNTCETGKLVQYNDERSEKRTSALTEQSFMTVKQSANYDYVDKKTWTVLDAVDKSGGKPSVSVSITVTVVRIIPRRSIEEARSQLNDTSKLGPSKYILIGQDPSGVFLVVEIPNRPLVHTISSLLENGEGTVQTITNVTVSNRMTDASDPGLFSLIKSLHESYVNSVKCDKKLLSLLQDQVLKEPQTFCYKFIVTLGQSENVVLSDAALKYFEMPVWTLKKALLASNSHRGSVKVNILYRINRRLYVTCAISNSKTTEVCKISINSSILPRWMHCDGTIMTTAVIHDVGISRDNRSNVLYVDEYSQIERIESEIRITVSELLGCIHSINAKSDFHDLVSVYGHIVSVNEDEAISWEECTNCAGQELKSANVGTVCQTCQSQNISVSVKYAMEVAVEIENDNRSLEVVVKLFQKTILKLLALASSGPKEYKTGVLQGCLLGPLVVVVMKKYQNRLFTVSEMPY